MNAQSGLTSLREKRLKISRTEELNDFLELLPFDLSDDDLRVAIQMIRIQMAELCGVLCFSESWTNPMLWAHYGDQHRGLCLGFEVAEQEVGTVEYVDEPIKLSRNPTLKDAEVLLFTKYRNWEHERECRVKVMLNAEKNAAQYVAFHNGLKLTDILVGCRCELTTSELTSLVNDPRLRISEVLPVKGRFEMRRKSRQEEQVDAESLVGKP